jgi:hypothetical protein
MGLCQQLSWLRALLHRQAMPLYILGATVVTVTVTVTFTVTVTWFRIYLITPLGANTALGVPGLHTGQAVWVCVFGGGGSVTSMPLQNTVCPRTATAGMPQTCHTVHMRHMHACHRTLHSRSCFIARRARFLARSTLITVNQTKHRPQ